MPELRDTRTPKSNCPFCLHKLDAAMSGDPAHPDVMPKPGDFSVCISCASILVFTDDLRLRAPNPGELETAFREDILLERAITRAQRAVQSIDRRGMRNG